MIFTFCGIGVLHSILEGFRSGPWVDWLGCPSDYFAATSGAFSRVNVTT